MNSDTKIPKLTWFSLWESDSYSMSLMSNQKSVDATPDYKGEMLCISIFRKHICLPSQRALTEHMYNFMLRVKDM